MALETLADLFYDELRDVLSAERQLVKAIPKMAKKASCAKLTHAFEDHLSQTEQHVERVEKAFEETGKSARAKECEAMKGLIKECNSMMDEQADPDVMDAALIACAQKVEHYEIATYGTLCTWAERLGYSHALKLLKQNIDDEEKADKHLTELSKTINPAAVA